MYIKLAEDWFGLLLAPERCEFWLLNERARTHIFDQVPDFAGSGNGKHMGSAAQRPSNPDLRGRYCMRLGESVHCIVVDHAADL